MTKARIRSASILSFHRSLEQRVQGHCFSRAAELLVREYVQGEFGVSGIQPMGRRLSRSFFRGVIQGRPIFIKVYRRNDIACARFQPELVEWLLDAGFKSPRVMHHALDREILQPYGCGCLITEWLDVGSQSIRGKESLVSAFGNLARLHGAGANPGEAGRIQFPPPVHLHSVTPKWAMHMVDRSLKRLRRAGVSTPEKIARTGFPALRRDIKLALAQQPRRSVLHLDYSPWNVVANRNGELYTLDLDKARMGCFAIDLAIAMTHYAFEEAPGPEVAALLQSSSWAAEVEDAYFTVAEPDLRRHWSAWRATYLRLAFLRKTGNLGARALDCIRHTAPERRGFARLAASCLDASLEWEASAAGER